MAGVLFVGLHARDQFVDARIGSGAFVRGAPGQIVQTVGDLVDGLGELDLVSWSRRLRLESWSARASRRERRSSAPP
jgi:hypothetical protein